MTESATPYDLSNRDPRGLDAEIQSGYLALISLHSTRARHYPPGVQREWHQRRAAILRDDLTGWQDLYGHVVDSGVGTPRGVEQVFSP
jgi:hypothetical protein